MTGFQISWSSVHGSEMNQL